MSSSQELAEVLLHFGTKGMKWGVRKKKDEINEKDRTIKKGTSIQNISSRAYEQRNKRLYASYTKADNNAYGDLMGNFMYNEKGYKNTFKVKKDIKIPSDRALVQNFVELAKKNPKQLAKDMSAAHNESAILFTKSAKSFERKISKLKDDDIKRGEKLTKMYIEQMVANKGAKSRADFIGGLIKKGYDGMSDANDRDGNGMQDPLIIFNTSKSLGKVTSVKLTKKDLDNYSKIAMSRSSNKAAKDLSGIQR